MQIMSWDPRKTVELLKNRKVDYKKYDKIVQTSTSEILLYRTDKEGNREMLKVSI